MSGNPSEMETNSGQPDTPSLVGTYTLASSENVEDYLKGLGVGLVLRKIQSVARPNCTISYQSDANKWTFLTESVFKTREVTFKPAEKFADETFDCRKCQSVVEAGEKILNWIQYCEEGPSVENIITSTQAGFRWEMKSGEFRCELMFRRGLPLHQMQNNE